ncbi:MAG: histidine phosphatase family protein [Phormidesmis sp.]
MRILYTNKSIFRFGLYSSLCSIVFLTGCTATQAPARVDRPDSSAAVVKTDSKLSEAASTPATATTIEEDLWQKLAQADEETYVLLLRHAIAPGTGDPTNFQLDDCSTQRNLSEEGRQQAVAIGEAFRSRDIPVIEVLSSQWCRCLETAELINVGSVEPFLPLNSFFRDRAAAEAQTAEVQDYVAANGDRPGVIIMITHQVNITALSGIFPQSGSAVVVEVNDGQLDVLGQILEERP